MATRSCSWFLPNFLANSLANCLASLAMFLADFLGDFLAGFLAQKGSPPYLAKKLRFVDADTQ